MNSENIPRVPRGSERGSEGRGASEGAPRGSSMMSRVSLQRCQETCWLKAPCQPSAPAPRKGAASTQEKRARRAPASGRKPPARP
eukprot:15322432-Alexandrium_andersonii.AAC.1